MKNIPPTEKEKMIILMIAKQNSKERIEEEILNAIKQGGHSEIFERACNFFSVNNIDKWGRMKISLQYLNYALKNYDDVSNKIFTDDFERVIKMSFELDNMEVTTSRVRHLAQTYGLTSLRKEIQEDARDNFWEFDPVVVDERPIDTEYYDKKFLGLTGTEELNVSELVIR